MPQKFLPGPGRIIIEPLPQGDVHTFGSHMLYLPPGSSKDDGVIGKVVAVYDKPYAENGMMIEGSEYALGAIVVIGKYTGTRLNLDRKEVIVVPAHAVIAEIVDEADPNDLCANCQHPRHMHKPEKICMGEHVEGPSRIICGCETFEEPSNARPA